MFKIILPKLHIEVERWKFNKNYQLYVSNMGNFRDKAKEKISLKVDVYGYLQVPFCNNKKGTVKYLQAHRVVMETWCPKMNMWKDKLTVDHLDHNKRNNTTKNLEWVTKQENMKRAANDLIRDDKDALIQSLTDKIKTLEKIGSAVKITAVGYQSFSSWIDIRNWLSKQNPNYKDTLLKNVQSRILKSSRTGEKYMGYYWKIK